MAIEKYISTDIVLDHPIDLVHRSLNDIKRMHKWNATVYFIENGPGDVDAKFHTVIDGYDTLVNIYSQLFITRIPELLETLEYPVINYGVRRDGADFSQSAGNVLTLELTINDDYPATKTNLNVSRKLYHTNDPEQDIPVRTKWSKCTEQLVEGLKSLQIDNTGLLSIPDKPDTPPNS